MRAPSSFHSTDAGPGGSSPLAPVASASASVTSAAVWASIGCTGRSTVSPTAGEPGLALVAGDDGHPGQVAGQHRRPAHRGERHAERLGGGVGDEPLERAVAQLAHEQAADEVLLGRGGPGVGGGAAGRTGPSANPAPRRPASSSSVRSRSRHGQRRRRRPGATSTAATVRQPTPMRPWRGAPVRMATTTGSSSPSSRAEQVGQRRHLGRPGPGGGDRLGGGDDVGEQRVGHRTILPSAGCHRISQSVSGVRTPETASWTVAGRRAQRRRTQAWRVPAAVSTVRLAPASAISTVVEPNAVVPNGLSNRCRRGAAPPRRRRP